MPMPDLLKPTQEVADALADGRPVVALESTVISHGLPKPDNVETALAMEAAVRASGAVPATIGLIDGEIRIGLSMAEIERFASSPGIAKVSRRDMAAVLAARGWGATTVAGTMIAAQLAGIRIFATGGIGGVHRGAETSMDVSADLLELARTPVMVVCAGAKSILDLPRTMEVLETQGVPVIGWRTGRLPAFHAVDSGIRLHLRADTAKEAADLAALHWRLGLGGLLLANPVPAEAAIDRAEMEVWIAEALARAETDGIAGKDVTPYLLAAIGRASDGRTLRANKALLLNNAKLAGEIAAALDVKDRP